MNNKYELPGFKIVREDFKDAPRFAFVEYKSLFCKFAIATDSMGTQICKNGVFFGPFNFKDIDEAINWLKEDSKRLQQLRKIYTKVWFENIWYKIFKRSKKVVANNLFDVMIRLVNNNRE